jgi:aldehyde:ferredoxin oxidoreductase
MVKMTKMIARREGFGDLLAEGSARAAKIIGQGSEDFLITIKNK